MTTINFRANTPEYYQEQKLQQQNKANQEFTALDKDQLKQDAVDLGGKAQEAVKDNWFVEKLKAFGINDPKKKLKSIIFAVATVVALGFFGNKTMSFFAKAGNDFEGLFKDTKWFKKITGAMSGTKNKVSDFLLNNKVTGELANNIKDTFANRKAKPVWNMARGTGQGPKTIFRITPVETIKNALINNKNKALAGQFAQEFGGQKQALKVINQIGSLKPDELAQFVENNKAHEAVINSITEALNKNRASSIESFAKLFSADGINSAKAKETATKLYEELYGNVENADWNKTLLKGIKEGRNIQSPDELRKFLEQVKKGEIDSTLINVPMESGGITSSWWPVNIINTAITKITGKQSNFGRGNTGDALMKLYAITGDLAETKAGTFIQAAPIVFSESISNFGNDKSGLGAFLTFNLINSFDRIQDTPKGKKKAVIAEETVGSVANWVITTPLAFGATYGLATLGNLAKATNSNSAFAKILTPVLTVIGKVFGTGLNAGAKNAVIAESIKDAGLGTKLLGALKMSKNSAIGTVGGIFRLAMVLFVFSSIFRKPVDKVIHKIFGDPTDKNANTTQSQQQQINQVIPELGISQKELMEKIQKNPQALEKIQNDPEAIKKLQQNPKLLLDVLDGKDINSLNASTSQSNPTMSPSLASRLNNSGQNFATEKMDKKEQTQAPSASTTPTTSNYDTATYIPSSEYIAKSVEYDDATISKMNSVLAASDKVLEQFEKVRTL